MALSPAEEAEYQRLGTSLGFLGNPAPSEDPSSYGMLGFSGRTAANILPGALEKIIQPAQALLGTGDQTPIPNFYDVRDPKGVGEHIIGGVGELAEYLPAMLLTEGAGAAGLARLGVAPRAAKVLGAGLGFGLPMAPEGTETAAVQGGVGALQTAAMDMGWRGKVAAGILGGAAGYYEGAKGPEGTPMQGAIYGGLNLLGPTMIDPLVNKLTGYKPMQDIGGGRPIEGQPTPPPPTSTLPGAGGIMDQSFQQMNAAQKQAYMEAVSGRSGPSPLIGPEPPRSGFFGDFSVNPGGGQPLDRTVQPQAGTFENNLQRRPGNGLFPIPDVSTPQGTRAEFAYSRQLNPYDAFAGLQKPSIMSQGEVTGAGGLFPAAPLTSHEQLVQASLHAGRPAPSLPAQPLERVFDPRTRMSETALSGADIYGGSSGIFNAFQRVERAPTLGPESIFSPREAATRAQLEVQRTAQSTVVSSSSGTKRATKAPHAKIPTGLQKLLGDDVGWTPPGTPLKEGIQQNAETLSAKLKTPKDIERAEKTAKIYRDASEVAEDLDAMGDYANRAQYFSEAAQFARDRDVAPVVASLQDVVPAIRVGKKVVKGMKGDTHQNILDRHLNENADDVDALLNFDAPDNPNFFVDAAGKEISRAQLKKTFGVGDSQGLRDLQSKAPPPAPTPPKTEPVKPAAAAAASKSPTLGELKALAKKLGVTVEEDKANTAFHIHAPEGSGWDNGTLTSLAHPYGSHGSSLPEWRKEGIKDAYERLMQMGAPEKIPTETPVDARPKVKVRGRFGMEEAVVVGKEGNTLHVEIDDPIFGKRSTSVLESDTQPVASLQPATPKGGTVPFQDVESVKLRGGEGARGAAQTGESEADLLGSVMEGSGPGAVRKTLPGKEKEVLTIEEGLKKLPPEAGAIIGEILHRIQVAAGKEIDTSLALRMPGAKGGMYELSGRVAINLQWVNSLVKNWDKMSEEVRARSLMRIAALFGHEVSHVAHKFAEKSNLLIDGVSITQAVMKHVDSMSQSQRDYVARQILEAKGDLNPSKGIVAYLSGDIDQVYGWYKAHRPGLTREGAVELAAGEVMAEIGSTELIKRMEVKGLPDKLREAINLFKGVMVRIIDFFRGKNEVTAVEGLAGLQNIAGKMFDHLAAGDTAALGKAFPASTSWRPPPVTNPFSSGTLPPSPTNTPPITVQNTGMLKSELARLGVRAAVGGATGGIVGPMVGPNQISTAEGVILGSVLGMFGPAVAKRLLSGNFPQEIKEAIQASKGNPVKTFAHIMGGGKSLRELGAEGRFGMTAETSAASKFVRLLESEFNLNLDPKLKALLEEGRGQGTVVLATVQDALDKVRWYKPSPTMLEAVDNYFQGKISKDEFEKLLTSPELQNYGRFITTAREGMTTLTQMFASGMRKSQFRDHLIETSDKYLGRFYSAYKEGKFNMKAFDKAKADFMERYPEYSDHTADSIMREFMREVQSNRSVFGGRRGNSGQKIDTSTTYRRLATEEEIEAQQVLVGGLEHNPFTKEYEKEKAKLDWMTEHKITDNWRDWLGEYKNPVERMVYSFQKIYPSAISAKIFDMLDNRVNSNGLKFSYTAKELVTLRQTLEHGLSAAGTDAAEVARLQSQIKELDAYGAVPEGSAYGKLQGKWVDRWTRDELNTYATPFKWMEQPIIRSIANFNNLIKVGRTAFNPLTTIRNYLQMPAFALIAKTTAGDIGEAFREIHRVKGDDYRLMLQRHIIGADFVTSELTRGPGTMFSGYMDSDIAVKAAKYGADKVMKLYQQPDMLVRAGAFISARKRFAQRALEEGGFASLQEAMLSPRVIDDAVNFTERYTMNYGTVPRIVKIGRQLPFVNLFISYTSEITRILKNLTEDAITNGPNSAGRMHAITVLGAMAAIPAMMIAGAKANLSPKDLADWEKLEKLSPDYQRGRFRIPTRRDENGKFHYFDLTNLLPADNYSQMIKAFSNGDIEGALAANPILSLQNTPLLNMAAEQIAGEDLRTGQKIEGYGRVREILKETFPPWMPPGYEGQRLVRAFSPNAEGGRGLTNVKSGAEYKPSDIIANYLTGMRFGTVNLATVQKAAISEAKQEIALQQQLMRDTTNLNVAPEQRQKAQAIYNEAVTQIMFKLHSRMGIPQAELAVGR